MNEHDELEPTVAMPRIGVPPATASQPPPVEPPPERPIPVQPIPVRAIPVQPNAVQPIPIQPIPAGPISRAGAGPARPGYVFGNPFGYALRRFFAFVLDFIVVTGVATMLLYGLIAINPFTGLPNNSEGGFDATVGMGIAIALIYVWLFESIFGTTLGKLAFSLHVYVPRRRFVGFGRALIRNLLRPLDFLVIGWILAMAPGHRRLGDVFSGTLVARSPLRSFSPLVGWVLIVALAGLPFVIAGGTVTVLAVGTAFVEFIPPLLARMVHAALQLFGVAPPHPPGSTG